MTETHLDVRMTNDEEDENGLQCGQTHKLRGLHEGNATIMA